MGGDGHKHKGGMDTQTMGGNTNTQTREGAATGTILMHGDTHGHTDTRTHTHTHTHTNTHTILRLSSILG